MWRWIWVGGTGAGRCQASAGVRTSVGVRGQWYGLWEMDVDGGGLGWGGWEAPAAGVRTLQLVLGTMGKWNGVRGHWRCLCVGGAACRAQKAAAVTALDVMKIMQRGMGVAVGRLQAGRLVAWRSASGRAGQDCSP